MKSDIRIEWLVEEIDEHGEIIEVTHCDSYLQARRFAGLSDAPQVDIGLVRDRGNDTDGLINRQWAYIDADGKLPIRFEDSGGSEGALVPPGYHREIERSKRNDRL
jgi:hypothetical protein